MKTATQGLAQTQEHDLNHQQAPTDLNLRLQTLQSLVVEKGLVDPAALDALIDACENKVGPRVGAHPMVDPGSKQRLSCFKAAAIHAALLNLALRT